MKITTEIRTDKAGRRCKWWILADGRAFRSEKQALAAKPAKTRKSKLAAPVAEVMTQAQALQFALAAETLQMPRAEAHRYARAMYCYMITGIDADDIRGTLNAPIYRATARMQARD